jgi:hypothetical protein
MDDDTQNEKKSSFSRVQKWCFCINNWKMKLVWNRDQGLDGIVRFR